LLKQAFQSFARFFVFSSIFIGCCAVMMSYQTLQLLNLGTNWDYLAFVFFASLCSYSFHWWLTPYSSSEKIRMQWMKRNKYIHAIFYFIGLAGCIFYYFRLKEYTIWILIAGVLTFLYSAPKVPWKPLRLLKKIAIGKTIFLAFVWMYVTTALPLFISNASWGWVEILFCSGRFFLIYAICIMFDYRDREFDRQEGIRSMITYFSENGIDLLFYLSLFVFAASTVALFFFGFSYPVVFLLIIPGIIVGGLYETSKNSTNDWLYYFVLDGLMMLSSLFTLLLSFL